MKSPFVTLRNGILAQMNEYGFKLFAGLFISYGWTLFGLNLLTILLCAPVVTAPAAICALNRVLMKLTLDGECNIKKEYWAEFKSSFFKVLPFFFYRNCYFCFAWNCDLHAFFQRNAGAWRICDTCTLCDSLYIHLSCIYICHSAFCICRPAGGNKYKKTHCCLLFRSQNVIYT